MLVHCLESQVFNTVVYLSGDIMAGWRSLLMCAEYVGRISNMAPDPGYVTTYLPWFSYPQAELTQQLTLTNRAHIPRRSYGTYSFVACPCQENVPLSLQTVRAYY